MGHYASEMRTAAEDAEYTKRSKLVSFAIKKGFTSIGHLDNTDKTLWRCRECAALVLLEDCRKHFKWHNTLGLWA